MKYKSTKTLKKYLLNHSLDQLDKYTDKFRMHNLFWDHVLVIPVCGEPDFSIDALLKNQISPSVLIILIINRPKLHEKTLQWRDENNQLIHQLELGATHNITLSDKQKLLFNEAGADTLLIDFNQQAFEKNKGVGLARKIGADSALRLIDSGFINNPWIFSTDADVELPVDYFSAVDRLHNSFAAVCLNFEHIGSDSELSYYQELYDLKLRYYQSGVRYTQSNYDYIPLGSTLIINADAYAKVRGFPIRSAGEDFYILNKLAKISGILLLENTTVKIKTRFSDRVPFGTGPAVSKIKDSELNGIDYQYYDPECFIVIKRWRQYLIDYYSDQLLPEDDQGLNAYWHIDHVLTVGHQQCKSKKRWHQFIHEWFDAFKILKSVHHLSEKKSLISRNKLLKSTYYRVIKGQ